MPHALIVEDEHNCIATVRTILAAEAYSYVVVSHIRQAMQQLAQFQPDIVIASLDGENESDPDFFHALSVQNHIPLVLMTSRPSVDSAVQALRWGAVDYLIKPVDPKALQQLMRVQSLRWQGPRHEESRPFSASTMLGDSAVMQTLRDHVARVAPTEASVLLLGESGTGKELVAQNIHALSARQRHPFLPVNCGAISPQLIESEIFGHEKGSFTGADRQHKGYFERASGGTLFLDEVVEMPIELQVKLLRVLETGTFMRIGSNHELHTDVRIIAATNRDAEISINQGRLRLDLFHRLNVFPLKIPSLRERGKDIHLLAQHFLDELNASHATDKQFSANALSSLLSYHWPGNVRELRNVIQRAYILSDHLIDASVLEVDVLKESATALTLAIPVGTALAEVDRKLIFATLDLCGGVKKRAAELLGISLKTLYNRLEGYGSASTMLGADETVIELEQTVSLPDSEPEFLN